jgi:hypothetical protein
MMVVSSLALFLWMLAGVGGECRRLKNESVTEVTTEPPVLKAQYVEGAVPHRSPLPTYRLSKATTVACVEEPARLVLYTTKSVQLAVPALNENFAG